MIEKFIKNPETRKRWRHFRQRKRAIVSVVLLIGLLFFSFTAEFWANSKPIVLRHQGQWYFPVIKKYHPTVFNQEETMVTNYRSLELKEGDWALWPIVRWDANESNMEVSDFPSPPTAENWFGTDDRGRDVFTRLLYGFRYSITFALLVWILPFILGIILGAIMGFSGGKVDLMGQRLVETFESMPDLLILIFLVSVFGASMWLLVLYSTLFGWMFISDYIRAEFLKLRKRDFVESARALGGSRFRQMFVHILPNALGPALTFSPFAVAGGISSLAILDYLGFGLPPPTPSLGELLQQAQNNFQIAWWLALYPSLNLFLALVVLNLIGEGIRDAFDPRQ